MRLIGALAGACADSTPALYARLADVLRGLHSLPAIFYVRQGESLHPVAGFDCSREVPSLPLASLTSQAAGELPANQVPLTLKGEIRRVAGDLRTGGRGRRPAAAPDHGAGGQAPPPHAGGGAQARAALEQRADSPSLVNAGELLGQLDVEVLLRKILESVLGAVGVPVGAVVAKRPRPPGAAAHGHLGHARRD